MALVDPQHSKQSEDLISVMYFPHLCNVMQIVFTCMNSDFIIANWHLTHACANSRSLYSPPLDQNNVHGHTFPLKAQLKIILFLCNLFSWVGNTPFLLHLYHSKIEGMWVYIVPHKECKLYFFSSFFLNSKFWACTK